MKKLEAIATALALLGYGALLMWPFLAALRGPLDWFEAGVMIAIFIATVLLVILIGAAAGMSSDLDERIDGV